MLTSEAVISVSLEKRPMSLETPASCGKFPAPFAQAPPPASNGASPVVENSLPLMVPVKFTWKKLPLNVIADSARLTVIGTPGKTAGPHRARCSLTQQLSGPVTDANDCVTDHWVPVAVGVVVGLGVGVGALGEEPPHAASDTTSARVRTFGFMSPPLVMRDHNTKPSTKMPAERGDLVCWVLLHSGNAWASRARVGSK